MTEPTTTDDAIVLGPGVTGPDGIMRPPATPTGPPAPEVILINADGPTTGDLG